MREERVQAALLAASHHIGLLNLVAESIRGDDFFRVEDPAKRMRGLLETLIARHAEALTGSPEEEDVPLSESQPEDLSVFLRMALSCLVDADHTDSSMPNRPLAEIAPDLPPPLLPERRLTALDGYVARLGAKSERDELRRAVYTACRERMSDERIVSCDSPVGSGKTTAVMAHLLSVAAKRGLRRIFVVLPFTNIIRQSAEVYRKALVLPGENPDDIVVEVHHLADFEDEASRDYAVRWNAPVVITTAVAFFETLAAARPSALRRLHELAGAAVFMDEAHAALPAKFLPLAWQWMQSLADEWNVHWVLASGSLVRFWEMPEVLAPIEASVRTVPALTVGCVRDKSAEYERSRVRFQAELEALSLEDLLQIVSTSPGPRLVILNTVQNAAIVARAFWQSGRFAEVFHLSTALTPADREKTLTAVKLRMNKDRCGNWVLVGTSCIEAGMDLDFASGFREMASLTSLLQASGRVNRSGARDDAAMVSFKLREENGINHNRGMDDSCRVLSTLLGEGKQVSAELCTEALQRELRLNPGAESLLSKVANAEKRFNFPEVEKLFKIISADTRTVIVSPDLVRRLEAFTSVDWREIQRHSVQIWGYNVEKLAIPALANHADIFKWHLAYSPFLGYMDGILQCEDFELSAGGVI